MTTVELVQPALEVVGGKWVAHVLDLLSDGQLRYSEVQTQVDGVSSSVLTRTLKRMERDGLVIRAVRPAVPPEVEYSITPLGTSVDEPLTALSGWAESHLNEVAAARQRYAHQHR